MRPSLLDDVSTAGAAKAEAGARTSFISEAQATKLPEDPDDDLEEDDDEDDLDEGGDDDEDGDEEDDEDEEEEETWQV